MNKIYTYMAMCSVSLMLFSCGNPWFPNEEIDIDVEEKDKAQTQPQPQPQTKPQQQVKAPVPGKRK